MPLNCQDSLSVVISTVTKRMVYQAMRQVCSQGYLSNYFLVNVYGSGTTSLDISHLISGWDGPSKGFRFDLVFWINEAKQRDWFISGKGAAENLLKMAPSYSEIQKPSICTVRCIILKMKKGIWHGGLFIWLKSQPSWSLNVSPVLAKLLLLMADSSCLEQYMFLIFLVTKSSCIILLLEVLNMFDQMESRDCYSILVIYRTISMIKAFLSLLFVCLW